MNPGRRRGNARPKRWMTWAWPAVVCLAVFLGCAGGSGSSGFDVVENAAIDQAIDEQRCVDNDGLVICPADTENGVDMTFTPTATLRFTATATPRPKPTRTRETPDETRTPAFETPSTNPSPSLTPTPQAPPTARSTPTRTLPPTETATPAGMRIDVGIAPDSFVDCLIASDTCGFSFTFTASGFADGTEFQVASRRLAPESQWQISVPAPIDPATGVLKYDALIAVPVEDSAEATITVQVAVLTQSTPIGAAPPSSVDALGDSSAEFAFVTPEILARPIR